MTQLIKKLLSYLPSQLPVGMKEFNRFADDIILLSGQYADRDSMVFAIASIVIHLKPTTSSVPKNYFVKSMRKAAANQVASQAFQDIKKRQEEAQKAAQALAAQQEVTTSETVKSEPNKEV